MKDWHGKHGRKINFTHSKSDEAKRYDNHTQKEQQQWSDAPRKNKLRRVPKTERTSLRSTKDKQARCNVESV
jgi:hypothetical protein